jgi:hypothetical protein
MAWCVINEAHGQLYLLQEQEEEQQQICRLLLLLRSGMVCHDQGPGRVRWSPDSQLTLRSTTNYIKTYCDM